MYRDTREHRSRAHTRSDLLYALNAREESLFSLFLSLSRKNSISADPLNGNDSEEMECSFAYQSRKLDRKSVV